MRARADRVRAVAGPPAPAIMVRSEHDKAELDYSAPGAAKLVATIDSPDDKLPPYSDTIDVTSVSGTHQFPITLGDGVYDVTVSAYDSDGHSSTPVHATLPANR